MGSGLKLLSVTTMANMVRFEIDINGFRIQSTAEITPIFIPKLGKEIHQVKDEVSFYKGFRDAVSNMDRCTVSINKVRLRINEYLKGELTLPEKTENDDE